jgi:hypothetical protein
MIPGVIFLMSSNKDSRRGRWFRCSMSFLSKRGYRKMLPPRPEDTRELEYCTSKGMNLMKGRDQLVECCWKVSQTTAQNDPSVFL